METFCVSCKKNTANKNFSVGRNNLMLLSNCAVRSNKKTSFIKNQGASGL